VRDGCELVPLFESVPFSLKMQWVEANKRKYYSFMHCLQCFGNRILGRWMWPSYSPFFKPRLIYLWSLLKHDVYRNNPRIEDDLRRGMHDFTSSSTYNEHLCYFFCVCQRSKWQCPATALNMPCKILNYRVWALTQGNAISGVGLRMIWFRRT